MSMVQFSLEINRFLEVTQAVTEVGLIVKVSVDQNRALKTKTGVMVINEDRIQSDSPIADRVVHEANPTQGLEHAPFLDRRTRGN